MKRQQVKGVPQGHHLASMREHLSSGSPYDKKVQRKEGLLSFFFLAPECVPVAVAVAASTDIRIQLLPGTVP